VNKFAAGIADSVALGLLTELFGVDLPVVIAPNVNPALARHPRFRKSIEEPPVIDSATKTLHAMPKLRSPDDRQTAITRLRFVMEDPTQLLSNSVAHFVIDQLCDHDNRPEAVVIPGFTNMTYPVRKQH